MNAFLRYSLASALLALSTAFPATDSGPVVSKLDVQAANLNEKSLTNNWLGYNGDYSGRRFSSLSEITPANVAQLRAQWVFHSHAPGILEVTPVVVDGAMFITASNDAYALDASTGRVLWHYARPISEGLIDDASGHINRGVAISGNRLYMETDNAHLLCLDARSGHLIWDVAYAEGNRNYGATSAPLFVKGKVLVGTSGGDDGVRGFVAAYNAESGELAWKFWTIPGPAEPGSVSWPGDSYLHGGGTTWMPGTYDPELNTVYWGTSNPSPDFDGEVRPGDDLYTDCVLAIDPDTGKLKWHYQFTPHDLYDYDATETPVLLDAQYHGQPRKLLVEANRNGFVYVLDRTDGKFLAADPFVEKLNWAKSIGSDGRPVRTSAIPSADGTRVCPGYGGATNWNSPTYSETTHLFYFLALEDCSIYSLKPQSFQEGQGYYSTGARHSPGEGAHKLLLAYDLQSGKFAWKYPQVGTAHSMGGVMSTSTGLVFFGDDAQNFEAVDGATGKPLWHFNTGQSLHASPMSYAVGTRQYVAIASGSDLFAFALP